MNVKIPFLTTAPEEDILFVFTLTPVWWFLGANIFIYNAVAGFSFLKLLMICFRGQMALRLPRAGIIYFFFLLAYLASILINMGIRPADRIFASFNNLAQLVTGFLVLVVVYNSQRKMFLEKLFKNCGILAAVTGVLGILFSVLWVVKGGETEFRAFLGAKIPALMGYPYFYNMLSIKGAMTDYFVNAEVPRLVLYSDAPTATGGLILFLWPLAMAWQASGKDSSPLKTVFKYGLSVLCLFVLIFSMSRSAFCAMISAWVFIWILARKEKLLAALFFLTAAFLLSGFIFQGLEWLFQMRQSSNAGRFELYEDALRVVIRENILMGVGIHLREGFTLRSLGSHALYIEFFLVSGLVGLISFLIFQCSVGISWFRLHARMERPEELMMWKYLGIAFGAMTLWLIGDTLVALPVITYAYFMAAGAILLLDQGISFDEN